ncbi:MAG TPA: hypothetical protein VGG49_10675 [Steroidobacteraceae bacterium]|jgi:hypothetical protein
MSNLRRQRGFVFLVVILAVVLLLAIALAAWYLINIPDRPLDSGITNALQRHHDAVPRQDNLFFALLAFDSTNAENINQQGRAIYAGYLAHRTADAKFGVTFDNAVPVVRQAFAGNRASLCGGRGRPEDCIERAIAYPEDLRRLITDNRLFLDRYNGVAGYTRLQNPVQLTENSPIASWSPFILGKRLFLTDIALQVDAGHIQQAVARLGPDIAFTRRLLAQQDILLIDKMILAASLLDSLEMVSDLVRTQPLSDGQYAQLSTVLPPLTDGERSLVGPLRREFDAFAAMIGDLRNPKNARELVSSTPSGGSVAMGGLSFHFIKYNSTLNAQWRVLTEKIALSRGGCTKFLSGATAFKSHAAVSLGGVLYNPIGNILSGIAAPTGIEYMHAMCDLDGMIRIVELELQARLQHVNDEQLAQFAWNGGARYANPFTGQPMHVDVARKTIDFEPLAQRDRFFFPWPLAAAPPGAPVQVHTMPRVPQQKTGPQ